MATVKLSTERVEMRMTSWKARDVACPMCGASSGVRCITKSGAQFSCGHASRWVAARKAAP